MFPAFYEGVSSMLAYQGDVISDGIRFFSISNVSVFSRIGLFTFNYGYNYDKKDVLFGNNVMDSKDCSHYVSANFKKEIAKRLTLQTGATFDNQHTKVHNVMPNYYYAMNEDSPVFVQDTIVSNDILEPYIYLNWDICKKVSMSMGARTNIPLNHQKHYLSARYSVKYTPTPHHSFILSAGKYHNYTQPDYYHLKYLLMSSRQLSLDYSYEKNRTKIQSALYLKQERGEQEVLITAWTYPSTIYEF